MHFLVTGKVIAALRKQELASVRSQIKRLYGLSLALQSELESQINLNRLEIEQKIKELNVRIVVLRIHESDLQLLDEGQMTADMLFREAA